MTLVLPKVNGIELTKAAADGLSQSYTETPKFVVRTMDGTAKAQQVFRKIETNISGSGYMLTGWEGLDFSSSVTLSCCEARTIGSLSNVITIPSARRSDVSPRGFAIVDGVRVSTPVNLVGDVATLTVVGGATQYIIGYYPEFSAFVEITQNGRQSWTLTAREV